MSSASPTEVETLKKRLEVLNAAYRSGNPEVSDDDFDKLLESYQTLTGTKLDFPDDEPEIPGVTRIPHIVPMQSLQKETTIDGLVKWIPVLQSGYVASPKVDGLSMGIRYLNGKLDLALSRGNGEVGEPIVAALEAMVRTGRVPTQIPDAPPGLIEIRGEAYIRKSEFHQVGGANARNSAAGLVRRQTTDPKQDFLSFISYRLIVGDGSDSLHGEYTDELNQLGLWGFEVIPFCFYEGANLSSLTPETIHPDHWTGPLDFDIDGVVISLNDLFRRGQLGTTSKYPRWAVAYKFEVSEAIATVLKVVWNTGRTGPVTPVYHFTPVQLNGTTVSQAAGHNLEFYQKLGAGEGDQIVVCKKGDVIPYVLRKV